MNRPLNRGRWGFRGARIVLGTVVLAASQVVGVVAAPITGGPTAVRIAAYDPSATYKGSHDTQRVYKIVQGPQVWKANRRPAMVREVACRDARRTLEQQGVWTGRLGKDGSCKSGDETQWATGNYLNYQAGPEATDADL